MNTTYSIRSNRLIATFDPDGARMRSLCLDNGPNLVLDVDDTMSQELRDAYGGTVVGPLANRVRGGQVSIGETVFQMPLNENGTTALHSGPEGLDRAIWTVAAQDRTALQLTHHLPDGHGGLPGNRDIEVWFEVADNTLTFRVTMTTDAPTPASIAHHPYWRVTPEHTLLIHATHYLPTDHANLPTGVIAPVEDTPFDHRTARPIDPGTDHNFCVAEQAKAQPAPMATLTMPSHSLEIASTEPGLQVYSGAFLPTIPEADIAPLTGVALEPQGWPDAVNHPDFPNVICTPDHPYSQITQYTLQAAT